MNVVKKKYLTAFTKFIKFERKEKLVLNLEVISGSEVALLITLLQELEII